MKKICSVDGCNKKHSAKTFCRMHYNRYVRHGDPSITKFRTSCTVDGCDRPHLAKGLCMMHHARVRKTGDPHKTNSRVRHYCRIEVCGNIVNNDGLCSNHLYRLNKYGDPEKQIKEFHMHGMSRSHEYKIYGGIKRRCYNKNFKHYNRYGGMGIIMCDRWKNSFMAFYEDMGDRPTPKHQIDRIDNDGNYEPDNCRWTTPKENTRNSSQSKISMLQAIEIRKLYENKKYTQKEIGELFGISGSNVACIITGRTWNDKK